ncbi:MAG: PAS domain S-box protein, partial [Geobacter sp.]
PQISEPLFSTQKNNHPAIVLTAPIFDATGKMTCILSGGIDLLKDNFLGKLATVKIGENGYLYLYNTDRTIIVHADKRSTLARDIASGVNSLFDRAIDGFEGTGETVDSTGVNLLSSFRRLKTTGWILAANYPQAEAYAPVYRSRWYLLAALFVVLSCLILVVWAFMRHLTAPLLTFTRHVEMLAVSRNELEPIRIETRDEIGTLANVFNQMVAEVNSQKKAVVEQQEFCRNLLQNSAVPTFVIDSSHRVVIWNKACEQLTGTNASDMVGTDGQWKPFYETQRPVLADMVMDGNLTEHLPSFYSKYDRSPFTADGLHAEGWFSATTSEKRFAVFDAIPVRNSDGKTIAAIETLQDITELKLTAEALRTLSQAIEQTPIIIVITNREGIIEYVNPHFTKVTGYSTEEAIGQNPRLLKSDWHPDIFYQELWATIFGGNEWHGEFRNKRKNGELYWEAASVSPVKNDAGVISHFIAVKEDVTERKWAEEELRRSDEHVRLLLQSTAEAIYGVNLLGKCTFANPACARLLGYMHPDEFLGKNMHHLIHHTRADGTPYPVDDCPMYRVFGKDEGIHLDTAVLWRADGTSFPAEFWAYPQRSGNEVVGAVVTFLDITERKRAEEELLESTAAAE